MRSAAALALVCASVMAAAAEVRVVDTRNVHVTAPAKASHVFQLYVYTFSGGRWRTEEAFKAAVAAAGLLEQCGVALTSLELRVLDAEPAYRIYSTAVSRELVREVAAPRPAVFFVDDTRNRPAFDAETIGRANASGRPELVNTIWVAHGARDLVQALAHELVHLLSDSGEHSDERENLMRDETSPRNVKLTSAQCERLRARGEANGLLQAR